MINKFQYFLDFHMNIVVNLVYLVQSKNNKMKNKKIVQIQNRFWNIYFFIA